MTAPGKKSLMRSIGEFFGHITRGVKTPVNPKRKVVREHVQEAEVQTANGPVTLRRRTIDEVEGPEPQQPKVR